MKSKIRAIGIPVALAVLLAAVIFVVQLRRTAEAQEQTGEDPPTWVETVPAEKQEGYAVETAFLGEAETARASRLGFELSGTLKAVHVDQGSEVVEGDILAELDTARLESRHRELTAALREAEASQRLAEANFKRIAGLVKSKVATPQELDEVRQSRETSAATVARVRAQLDSVEIDLRKSVIRAPFGGTVAQRFLDEGSVVEAGRHVVDLLETSHMEIRAGIPPTRARDLEAGEMVTIRTRTGEVSEGKVLRLAPQRGAQTRTMDLVVDAPSASIVDGDLVEILLSENRSEPGYWLPVAALTESARGLWACYVAAPDGGTTRVERRQLEVLHEEGDHVYVRGALDEGDQVVVNGIHRLTPGLTVQVIDRAAVKTASNP